MKVFYFFCLIFLIQSKKTKSKKSRKAMLVEPLKAHNYVGTMSANNSP